MKRWLSLFLVFVLSLTFSACQDSAEDVAITTTSTVAAPTESSKVAASPSSSFSGKTTSSKSRVVTETSSTQTTVSSEVVVDDTEAYKKLDCRTICSSKWKTVWIKHNSTGMSLQVEIPDDWQLSKSGENTLSITRSGKNIGVITTSSLPKPKGSYETSGKFREHLDGSMQINEHTENGAERFSRCYQFICYENEDRYTVNMRINYTELDESAASYLLDTGKCILKENPFVHPSQTNGSKEILILGNSFIGTSQIGEFLNDMLRSEKSEYYVNAISIGMAGVATFASDTELCNSIAQGKYCYVFMCGFYSTTAVVQLQKIHDVCVASRTPLVIFPAHNEVQTAIDSGVRTYRNLCLLDWKGEINALIESGVSYDDFCVNDYHKHSKPLAGYVGAHMIYRTLFGDPPALSANAPLTDEYVNSKLGDYITTGGVIKDVKENSYQIN